MVYLSLLQAQEGLELLTSYEHLATQIDNPGLAGAFNTLLGAREFVFGHFDEGIEICTKAAKLCEAAGNYEDAGFACMLIAACYLAKGDCERVLVLKEAVHRLLHMAKKR
jgi:hypothetical protein